MLEAGGGWFNDNGSDITQGVDRLHYACRMFFFYVL